ncbi:hypothetical protein PTKU64_77290 [Paraburkholderia terrae]|uniref:Uncharacterized protein n=1 Tax=Paraburkholderia terrae TaxID=311230 RepID=A0ABM7TYV0_9BURK|nr:hypothetical protein [Paraburkholderia terrae]BCZ84054.1 hypothetical protein PTKU64_77290 [Paraburkholderia terrae]
MSNTINSVLNGGMMVPQVDSSGQIMGYGVDVPSSVVTRADGSTLYTFSSGVTYQRGSTTFVGPLQDPTATTQDIWTIPQAGGILGLFGDGSYGYNFTDSNRNKVAEVYIVGPGDTFSVSGGATTFINEVGSNKNVNAANGSYINVHGNNNRTNVSNSTLSVDEGLQASVYGNNNSVSVDQYGSVSVNGGGNTVTMRAGSSLNVDGTNGNADTIFADGDPTWFGLPFQGCSISLGTNTQANIWGSYTGVTMQAGDMVGLFGSMGALVMGANCTVSVNGGGGANQPLSSMGGGGSTVTFRPDSGGGTVNVADNSRVSITGSSVTANCGGNDWVYCNGTGNTVNASRTADQIAVGGNGQNASDVNNNHVNFYNVSGTVTQDGDSRVDISGNGITVNTAGNDRTGLSGSGGIVNVNGSGTTVSIGGNGQNASDVNNNHVKFNGVSGTVNQTSNSRADITGNGITINTAGNNNTGMSGSGAIVNVNGGGTIVTVGGNGQVTPDANNNHVNFNGVSGTVNQTANSRVDISGNGIKVNTAGNNSTGLTGSGGTVNVNGSGTNVWIGGNGQGASDANSNHVIFNGVTGTVTQAANSRTDVNGDGITMWANSNDNVGLYGSGGTINVNGSGTNVRIGGNGQIATNDKNMHVNFNGVGGTVTEIDNSRVDVHGNGVTVNAGSNDSVGVEGNQNTVNVSGTGTNIWISGHDNNVTQSHGTVTLQAGSTASLSGGDDTAYLLGTGGYIGLLSGKDYTVSAQGSTVATKDGTNFVLCGSGNQVQAGSGCAGSIYGDGNTVNAGTNTSIVNNGVNNTVKGSSCVITVGQQNINQVVYITGDHNFIDCSAISGNPKTKIIVTGSQNIVQGTGLNVTFSGTLGNTVYGSANTISGTTYGQIPQGNALIKQVMSSYNIPDLSAFPVAPLLAGDHGGSHGSEIPGTYELPCGPGPGSVPFTPSSSDPFEGVPIVVTARDPIILNLTGQSVQTMSVSDSRASFDMENNGQKVQTGWGTAGEGYLVYDPNDSDNTAIITRDSQLVAGFGALQELALQANGAYSDVLTATDALWHDLKVWVDTTGTAQFQSGQLYSLDQLGITSININGTQVSRDSNGNQILIDSTFTRADGTTGDMAGVNLMYRSCGTSAHPQTTSNVSDLRASQLIDCMGSFGSQSLEISAMFASVQQEAAVTLLH